MRSRGTKHNLSDHVAGEVRSLAIDLFNNHDLLDISRRLTAFQQVVFAEMDSVVERSRKDATALSEIAQGRA